MTPCPFCGSPDTEQIAPWAGQIITSQARCRACNTYFETVRDDYGQAWMTNSEDDRSAPLPPDRCS